MNKHLDDIAIAHKMMEELTDTQIDEIKEDIQALARQVDDLKVAYEAIEWSWHRAIDRITALEEKGSDLPWYSH